MSEHYSEHVGALRRLAVTLQGVIEAADTFERLGSIENATMEAASRRTIAEEACAQAQRDLQAARSAVEEARRAAEKILGDAKGEVHQILDDARRDCEKLAADAKEKALQEIEKATAIKSEELNRLVDEIERKRGELFQLSRETEQAGEAKRAADASYTHSKRALDKVLMDIEAIKAPKVSV